MNYRIEILESKKLLGLSMKTSLVSDKTSELWASFMSRRIDIKNTISNDLYSLQIYDSPEVFEEFDINKEFLKWAAIEVKDFSDIPEDFKTMVLEGGLYAVFLYIGSAQDAYSSFEYIFGEWLPNSEYVLDDRPHFEILGSKYKNNSSDSEEEIWIPVKKI